MRAGVKIYSSMKIPAQCSAKPNGRNCQKIENERENVVVALCSSIKLYGILIPWSPLAFHLKNNLMEIEKIPRVKHLTEGTAGDGILG